MRQRCTSPILSPTHTIIERPAAIGPNLVLDRRHLLTGLAGGVLCGGLALPAKPAFASPEGERLIALTARAFETRFGEGEGATSRVFRFVPEANSSEPRPAAGAAPPIPVLRARQGEMLRLSVSNALAQPIGLHCRGLRQANAADGVPGLTGDAIAPGASVQMPLATNQPGTFLLTSLVPDFVAEQRARGLVAILIVEERAPPPVDHDLVLAIGDVRLDDAGVLDGDFWALRDLARVGRLGNRLLVNGRPAPERQKVAPGARLRLRLVNVSNARGFPLTVRDMRAAVIAIDSTPCTPFDPLKRTVFLSPGSRVEMIVDLPAGPEAKGRLEAKAGNGLPLLDLSTEGASLPDRGAVAALPAADLPPAIRLQDATRASLTISGGLEANAKTDDAAALARAFPEARRVFRLLAGAGEMSAGFAGRPLVQVKRNGVLVLALSNKTAFAQVLAVHGHAFRLLHPFDDGWEPYFLDTLYLAPGTNAHIALIADRPGRWAIRSSVAEHFAAGIATWFDVRER